MDHDDGDDKNSDDDDDDDGDDVDCRVLSVTTAAWSHSVDRAPCVNSCVKSSWPNRPDSCKDGVACVTSSPQSQPRHVNG